MVWVKKFVFSAGVILIVTGAAKVFSASFNTKVFNTADPLFGFYFKYIFWAAGLVELMVGFACLRLNRNLFLPVSLLVWVSSCISTYRLGLIYVGYHKACSCLGNFSDALHISPLIADRMMKILLLYLLVGSYAALFWLWRQKKRGISLVSPGEKTAGSAA